MKNYLSLALMGIALTGCIAVPTSQKVESNPAALIKGASNVDNSKSDITRVNTRGQLLCEQGQVCPEVEIDWNKSQGAYPTTFHIYDRKQYEIKEVNIVIDGKTRSFSPIGNTTSRNINNSGIFASSNSIEVPSSYFSQINKAKNIQVILSTNDGDLVHDMLRSGKQSDAYRLFLRAY